MRAAAKGAAVRYSGQSKDCPEYLYMRGSSCARVERRDLIYRAYKADWKKNSPPFEKYMYTSCIHVKKLTLKKDEV